MSFPPVLIQIKMKQRGKASLLEQHPLALMTVHLFLTSLNLQGFSTKQRNWAISSRKFHVSKTLIHTNIENCMSQTIYICLQQWVQIYRYVTGQNNSKLSFKSAGRLTSSRGKLKLQKKLPIKEGTFIKMKMTLQNMLLPLVSRCYLMKWGNPT